MALLAKQSASVVGVTLTANAATAGGGDTVLVDGPGIYLLVRNGSGSAVTVTIVDPRTQYGQPSPDVTYSVAAGAIAILGPIPPEFADASQLVAVTYSSVTTVTVSPFRG